MPLIDGLRVVRSPIHGYGIVATRAFAEGEKIAEVEGVAWRAGDGLDDTYSLFVEEGLFFDMVDQTRWINHCCEPNAGVESGVTDGKVWARIVAERAIAEGEEITYDYAFPAHLAEPCRCGAAKCRGLIIEAA